MEERSRKQILMDIKTRLETIFTGVNEISEDLAHELVRCVRDFELVIGSNVNDEAMAPRSEDFANKHKEFCMEMSQKFENRGLQHFIHVSDSMGDQTISFGKMDENVMMKAISGAMIMSKFIFQGVCREMGMGEHCVECMTNVPDNVKMGYSEFDPSNPKIPQKLKAMLEEKFGGQLVAMGAVKIPKGDGDNDEGDKDDH